MWECVARGLMVLQICKMLAFEILIMSWVAVYFWLTWSSREQWIVVKLLRHQTSNKRNITPNIKTFAHVHNQMRNRKEFVDDNKHYTINQVILAFWLVLAFFLLEDWYTIDVNNTKRKWRDFPEPITILCQRLATNGIASFCIENRWRQITIFMFFKMGKGPTFEFRAMIF